MAKKPVRLGPKHFSSKLEAKGFLRDMLKRYKPGEDVSEADSEILRAALLNHPEAQQKIGAGVTGFRVRSAEFRSQCFWVMRTDGSTEKFSYKSCV